MLFTVGSTAVVKAGFRFGTKYVRKITIKLEYNTDLGSCLTTFITEEKGCENTLSSHNYT